MPGASALDNAAVKLLADGLSLRDAKRARSHGSCASGWVRDRAHARRAVDGGATASRDRTRAGQQATAPADGRADGQSRLQRSARFWRCCREICQRAGDTRAARHARSAGGRFARAFTRSVRATARRPRRGAAHSDAMRRRSARLTIWGCARALLDLYRWRSGPPGAGAAGREWASRSAWRCSSGCSSPTQASSGRRASSSTGSPAWHGLSSAHDPPRVRQGSWACAEPARSEGRGSDLPRERRIVGPKGVTRCSCSV